MAAAITLNLYASFGIGKIVSRLSKVDWEYRGVLLFTGLSDEMLKAVDFAFCEIWSNMLDGEIDSKLSGELALDLDFFDLGSFFDSLVKLCLEVESRFYLLFVAKGKICVSLEL